jgi:hypothetical protein
MTQPTPKDTSSCDPRHPFLNEISQEVSILLTPYIYRLLCFPNLKSHNDHRQDNPDVATKEPQILDLRLNQALLNWFYVHPFEYLSSSDDCVESTRSDEELDSSGLGMDRRHSFLKFKISLVPLLRFLHRSLSDTRNVNKYSQIAKKKEAEDDLDGTRPLSNEVCSHSQMTSFHKEKCHKKMIFLNFKLFVCEFRSLWKTQNGLWAGTSRTHHARS